MKSLRPVMPVPGAGMLFALRAIGIVLVVRWLFSMEQMDFVALLISMASSLWACVNLLFMFLLIVLPGAKARAERPFHPLPRWLRQALQALALLVLLFSVWLIGGFVWSAGVQRTLYTTVQNNGWLVITPALYVAVIWLCRPRALWHTHVTAKHFAIGHYAVALNETTHTAVVWAETRRIGQYDARELEVRWTQGGSFSRVGLIWDAPAAAGHHQRIFSVPLLGIFSAKTRMAARALDEALRAG